jgi:F0F1-type ATP synthase membrane subunit b/b'
MAGLVVSATQKIVQEKLDKDKDKSLIKKILSEVTGV